MFRSSHLMVALFSIAGVGIALAQTSSTAADAAKQPNLVNALHSPDGVLAFGCGADGGRIYYQATFGGKTVIRRSELRLESPLMQADAHFELTKAASSQHDATYHRISGKASTIRDHYNAETFEFS